MGVKGLLSYITDDDNDVLQTAELSQLATKIYYETKKTPKLLCDFMNLVSHFLQPPVIKLTSCGHYPWYAQVTGADFHLIADRACNFVAALKHLGVEPVFFIDGARGIDESFEGKIHVLKNREAQKLQEFFRLQQVCEHTVDKEISMYPPCNAIRQIKKSLKKAGAEIVYCNGEADPEIIHYAQSHDEVCGILSNDSDFAITNGCVMFPIDTFDVNNSLGLFMDVKVDEKPSEIVCQVIYPSRLADSLGIRVNQLPDLAVLCGTDYTYHLNKRLSVLTRLGVKGEYVNSVAEWLKTREMPLLQYQPMQELCIEHPEMQVAVEQSYSNYSLPQSINNLQPAVSFASPLFHIIEKEACSGKNTMLLPVAKKGIHWRTMVKENLTLGQPCLSGLLLPLRKVMYALLGVQEVREYGRSQMQAYDEVVVPVCTKPGDIELGIQCFHSLRELEQSGRLVGMYRLMNKSLHVKSISDVKKVVNGVVRGSQKLPNLPILAQSAMLCCCLKFIACLNKVSQPPLGLTDSELDAILITCLTCATDGQIMPHIVNVMPSMRTFTVSEWFALILTHCYRMASLIDVASCPEPKQMFYQMAFVPYHLALESHINLTTEQQVEIRYIQNVMKTFLVLPKVEAFRASIFNPGELQPLSLLVTLFGAALDEVKENAGEWFPCVMAMDYKDLVKDLVKGETICSRSDPETGSESSASQPEYDSDQEYHPTQSIGTTQPTHFNQPPIDSKPGHQAKMKSLSSMSLSARQSVLKDYFWDRKELPIMEHKGKILNLMSNYQVVCIEGETGCGKSSQVPQFILKASQQCKILASQPNLLAAKKLAERVSTERGEPPGKTVGYCDELDGVEQQLTFGTTGYMLKALLNSQTKCSYSHIILDEIHERSTEIDYALFITRKLAVTFPDLKIILVSATLQGNLFIEYFRNKLGHDKVADPHFVGIKRFPVKVVFIDQLDELVSVREDKEQCAAMNQLQLLARRLEKNAAQLLPYAPEITRFTEEVCTNLIISQLSPGEAVLIFLSGFGDINEFCNNLHRKLQKLRVRRRYRLFILHSQVQSEDQNKAFQKPLKRTANIIVANRGSESSLTIPYLRLVINFGINKEMMYNSAKRISELRRQWCSRASCIQREGRAGRVCEGVAVHLFTKEFYETLPDFGPPEIIRVPLAKTFLKAKEIGPQLGIPLPSRLLSMVIEPPSFVQFSTALHDLAEYGAIAHSPQQKISEEVDVTLLGKFSLSLPLDLNLCRLVLLGILFGCPLDGIVIAAATAMYQDVFLMPMKIIMNDLHQFCHSLNTSTFSRMKYDDGCYSNPIMVLNMFIDWLQYKSRYPDTSRRDLAFEFGSNNAVKPARLLHFEEFVGDIARCVASCIPQDTALYSELQTLSSISTERKGLPVFSESHSFLYKASPSPTSRKQDRSTRFLHFCNSYIILKTLIAAAAPDEILCGERACESSHPSSRTFAHKCINVIEKECFSLSHTLCMDLSKLDEEEMQEIDEAALEELFENFPGDFDLSVKTKVVRDVAVLHFRPDPSSVLTKTAKLFPPSKGRYSTAGISRIPPEVNFFWRFGEQNFLWEIDEVDALFPAPSHPCALMWYKFDESKSKVNTVKFNFRNPTGFVCQFDKPSQPYFAVATGAFASSGGSILAPRLTVLPNMPTSLMMVLAFQLSTSTIEFLINKKDKTIEAIKINSVEIPCTDIQNYISSDEINAINEVRKAISNVMALPLNNGCLPLRNPAITRIPALLHDLLRSCKPSISKSTTSNLQSLPMDDRLQGLVWEVITPGISIEDHSTSYYGEFRCSLVKTKPYDVKEVSHDQEPPQSTFSIEYTQSVSAKLLAESKRAEMEHALNDLAENSKLTSPVSGKMKLQKDRKAVLGKKKVEREIKSKRKESKRAGKKAAHLFCSLSSSLSSLLEASLEDMVQNMDETYLREEGKIRKKLEKKRKKKEKRKAEKKALLIQKEKMMGMKGAILPFSPVGGGQRFLYDQQWIVLSKYCSELSQKKDQDAQVASTTKKNLPTQSDTAGLENTKLQAKSVHLVSQTVTTKGHGKQTVSKPPTTATLLEEKGKICLKTVESNPSLCSERKKNSLVAEIKSEMSESSSTERNTETANRCQLEENLAREKQKRRKRKRKKKIEVALATSNSKPAKFGIAAPETCERRSVLSGPQSVPTNGQSQTATDSTKFLEDKRKGSFTAVMNNPTVRDERNKISPETLTKTEMSENGSIESMTGMAPRCQTEIIGNHTKKPLKETSVSDITPTKQKAAGKVVPSGNSAQCNVDEHMAQLSVGFINECGGETRSATLGEEAPLREKNIVQKEKETAITEERKEAEKTFTVKRKELREADLSEKQKEKVIATKDKEKEKAALSDKEKDKRKNGEEGDQIQKERKVALCKKEREEREKHVTLNESKNVKTEEAEVKEEDERREKREAKSGKKNERKKKEASLAATNSDQNPPAHSGIAEPKGRSVVSVSQTIQTTCNGEKTVSKSLTAPLGVIVCTDEGKGSLTIPTGHHERKKTGPETMSGNGSTKSTTRTSRSKIEPLKVISDITPTKQKAAGKVVPSGTSAQYNEHEHMAQFSFGFINECGGQTRSATPREEAPLREKDIVHNERETAITEEGKEAEKTFTVKRKELREADLSEKQKEKVIATKEKGKERAALSDKQKDKKKNGKEGDQIQKEKEAALCEKEREEREKHATLKKSKNVKTEEAEMKEEDERREKREAKSRKKNERKKKEASLAATNSDQNPPAHFGIAEPKERSVVSVSQTVPTTGNGKKTVSKSLAAPLGAIVCTDEGKGSLTIPTGHHERKKTGPETMSGNGSTKLTPTTSSSKIEPLKVISDITPTKQKAAGKVVPSGTSAQYNEHEHMAQFSFGFINECGGQTRSATPKEEAPLREKDIVHKERETAITEEGKEAEKTFTVKRKELREADLSEKQKEKVIATKEKEKEKAALSDKEKDKRKNGEEGDQIQKERKVALCKKEREEREKHVTLKKSKNVKTEEAEMKEEDERREKREAKSGKKNERKTKEAPRAATNSDQNPPAYSGISESKERSVVSASQSVQTTGNGKKTVSKSLNTPLGAIVCTDEGKGSLTIPTGHHERKKTGPGTMSENGSTKSTTRTSRSKIEPLKVISDITPTEQKAAGKVVPSGTSAQYNVDEHMAQFSFGFINGCGEQTRSATPREEAPLRKKDIVHNERETAIAEERIETEKTFTVKRKEVREADLSEKNREKVIATKERGKDSALGEKEKDKRKKGEKSDQIQKEREVALSKKEREEKQKQTDLKESKNVKTEEAEMKEEDERREKREAKSGKKNERKTKEAPRAATNSDQNPPAHSGISEPKGRSVVSVSQTVPTTGNSKKTVSKSLTAPLGAIVCTDEEKGSLITIPTGHHERKKTGPETMSGNGSTKLTPTTSHSKIEPLKVISDITPTKQKAAGKVVPSGTSAQYNEHEHIAQFTFGFINECGEQTRSATPREEASFREKDIVHKERETTITEERIEAEKTFTLKEKEVREADLSEKNRKKVIATKEKVEERAALGEKERERRKRGKESDQIQKEVALCKKEREEGGEHANLKESKNVKTEEAEVKEEDEKREKREAKKRKEKNERKKKKASLVATNSDQNPPAHFGMSEPKERSVVSVSQTVPTTGNGKKTVCKSLTAPLGAIVCTDEGKGSLTIPTGHHERKKTGPETMSGNSSTKSTTRTSRSKIEVMKVTQTKKPAKETAVPDGSPTMQNAASRVAPERNKAVSFAGSPEDVVEYLCNYLSSHFFPYGCPVSSLDALYQNEYRPRCSHPAVPTINASFLKVFSNYFVLQVGRTFVKLKEGVDHSDTSQLKGCPYTPQHVNDYFRRYLAKEGVVCTQQLRVLFSEGYMKEFKMPQNPIVQFIQEDFFKQSRHLFVTFVDIIVFRK